MDGTAESNERVLGQVLLHDPRVMYARLLEAADLVLHSALLIGAQAQQRELVADGLRAVLAIAKVRGEVLDTPAGRNAAQVHCCRQTKHQLQRAKHSAGVHVVLRQGLRDTLERPLRLTDHGGPRPRLTSGQADDEGAHEVGHDSTCWPGEGASQAPPSLVALPAAELEQGARCCNSLTTSSSVVTCFTLSMCFAADFILHLSMTTSIGPSGSVVLGSSPTALTRDNNFVRLRHSEQVQCAEVLHVLDVHGPFPGRYHD